MKHTQTILKRINISAIILFILAGCAGGKQSDTESDDLITVDVTTSYPHKKLVLQDFMDVEYFALETTDEFLCRGLIQAVGKDIVVAVNFNGDGNIFIYGRDGKALKKINRKGGGNEEYNNFSRIVLDDEKSELFVNDDHADKILVYDLEGNFKRRLSVKEDLSLFEMYNFNQESLICHDAFHGNTGQSFMLISKQDGSITKEIHTPFKEKKTILIRTPDKAISDMFYTYSPSTDHPIMPCFNDYILTEHSADTLYRFSPDRTLKPFIVRTPSVQSMTPEKFLLMSLLTDRYYFMETIEKILPFPSTDIVYDKQEKALFQYKVYNDDYVNEREAFLKSRPLNNEVPSCQFLEAGELVRDYEGGRLKGKLKEVAATLDPEDNPVIMLIKHKKKL